MRIQRIIVFVLCVTLVTAVGAGCGRRDATAPEVEPTATSEPTVAPPVTTETTTVRVYFTRGEKIGVAGREVEQTDKPASLVFATVQALLEGPTAEEQEFGLGTVVPRGTTVNSVEIENGTATVDLSESFQSGGGSLSMLLRVAQVVCTLTQFDEVEAVAFMLGGTPVEAIGGEGVVVDPPVNREDFEDQLPAILVESPVPGQEVSSPLTVSGSSNVFEATHQLQLTDPDGLILVDKYVMATSGTGTRGTWSDTVEYGPLKRDGMGAVIVFDFSPKDGSRQDIIEIPVKMKR